MTVLDDLRSDVAGLARRGFGGAVHMAGDAGYDAGRRGLYPEVDSRPVVVAEARSAEDVRAAVTAARENLLPLAVQATGHGTRVVADGGMLLRTDLMRGVRIDPVRRVARVRPGTKWGQVLAAASAHGLAPLSGSSPDVGVVGYTVGGGLGWLGRRHGFAADSVTEAEVVTADGEIVTANDHRNADLFWALRGGGGNFGLVTSLEFKLYPVHTVYAGFAWFPIERAAETIAFHRQWGALVPNAMSTAIVLTAMPGAPERRAMLIKVMYAGEADEARRLLQPLWEVAGPAHAEDLRVMPYAEAAMGGTPARHLDLFDELPDPVIETLVEAGRLATVEIRHWGGALSDPGPGAGPAGHRSTAYSAIIDTVLPGVADRLRPHANGGSFLNFLIDPARTGTAFTFANLHRLREVKRAHDPDNFFRLNFNIAPADPRH
ncbi:FAD-binding oxidoreductase [Bailinhaonella thermotolerans]|uniref:FAD-binding oxidoreductase n=1 Tax=Bailinhaonella thermotolerans TaxID=1070861 RepID=A0A3A4BLR7_9ACTN|nr:FAD-dependent oxidoreductase [Bailinhaonella thermotolerans]RJL31962.1 FAD-binding oxidoreductase [Bailinhaonella thermotolerans]